MIMSYFMILQNGGRSFFAVVLHVDDGVVWLANVIDADGEALSGCEVLRRRS